MILEGKIWKEFDQYNATIELLYLNGNGQTEDDALDDLIRGYSDICSRVTCRVLKCDESSFRVEFSDMNDLLEKIIRVLLGSRKMEVGEEIKIDSLDDYLKYFKKLE